MSRWTTTTTAEQKRAAVNAYLGGISAPKVEAMAAAGELPGQGPFSINRVTIRRHGRAEKARRAHADRLDAANRAETVDDAAARILALLLAELEHAETIQPGQQDLPKLKTLLAMLRDLQPRPVPTRQAEPQPTGDTDPSRELLARMTTNKNGQDGQDGASSARARSVA